MEVDAELENVEGAAEDAALSEFEADDPAVLLPVMIDTALTVEDPIIVGPRGTGGKIVDVVCGINVLPAFGGPL